MKERFSWWYKRCGKCFANQNHNRRTERCYTLESTSTAKQLTVSIRNEAGDVVLRRQVSTQWGRLRDFFEELRRLAEAEHGFAAIVEVCGFNDWLLKMMAEYGCRETVLIQAEKRSKKKTDRRDAYQFSGILWLNRHRLATIIWQMVKHKEPYLIGGPPRRKLAPQAV